MRQPIERARAGSAGIEALACHGERVLSAAAHVQDVGEVDVGGRHLPRQAGLPGDLECLAQRAGALLGLEAVSERGAHHVERAHLDVAYRRSLARPRARRARQRSTRRSATGACGSAPAPPAAPRARATARPLGSSASARLIVSTLSSWRFRLQSARDSRSSTAAARLRLGLLVDQLERARAAASPGARRRRPRRRRWRPASAGPPGSRRPACSGSGTRSHSASARSQQRQRLVEGVHALGGDGGPHRGGQRGRLVAGGQPVVGDLGGQVHALALARRSRCSSARAIAPCCSARSPGSRSS